MGLLTDISESIARQLRKSEYFRTSPKIPVVVEESKDVFAEIDRAASIGCMVLVNLESADQVNADSPGPYAEQVTFRITISEAPQLWRASNRNAPPAASIAQAVCQLLHHFKPVDADENSLVGGVLISEGFNQRENDSYLQYIADFTLPVVMGDGTTEPTR